MSKIVYFQIYIYIFKYITYLFYFLIKYLIKKNLTCSLFVINAGITSSTVRSHKTPPVIL